MERRGWGRGSVAGATPFAACARLTRAVMMALRPTQPPQHEPPRRQRSGHSHCGASSWKAEGELRAHAVYLLCQATDQTYRKLSETASTRTSGARRFPKIVGSPRDRAMKGFSGKSGFRSDSMIFRMGLCERSATVETGTGARDAIIQTRDRLPTEN